MCEKIVRTQWMCSKVKKSGLVTADQELCPLGSLNTNAGVVPAPDTVVPEHQSFRAFIPLV